MLVQIRPARPGDGEGLARVWLSAGAYYADLDPAHFQVPSADGLAESFASMVRLDTYVHSPVSVPFYERHMGYQRRSIYFVKELLSAGEQGAEHVLHDAAMPVILRFARGVDPHDRAEFLSVG